MLIKSIEFVELELPFRSEFSHARKMRTSTTSVLVSVTTSTGSVGWGEIVPRGYVTGETVDSIFNSENQSVSADQLAQDLIGRSFGSQHALISWIDEQLPLYRNHTALFGGVELALWNALSQTTVVDFDELVGPINQRQTGHCFTIGFESATDSLRKQAIAARMTQASVIKLKIGAPDDVERLRQLDSHLKGKVPIRVDANGQYSAEQAESLLEACAQTTSLQSFEEPFARDNKYLLGLQHSLHERFGIGFVADESACSLEDVKLLIEQRYFQIINLRIGKHGGLWASRKIRDYSDSQGMGLVCGSMVGETGILTQASELLLSRSTQFDYVEGLGQNSRFLAIDPVHRMDPSVPLSRFRFKQAQCEHLIKRRQAFH